MALFQGAWWRRFLGRKPSFEETAQQLVETGQVPPEEEARFRRYLPLYAHLPRKGGAFEGFVITEVVAGTYGIVYRGQRPGDGERFSALKVFRPDLIDDPAALARFVREQEVMRAVDHPQVVKLRSGGALRDLELEGVRREIPYFEMEYLEGMPLAVMMTRDWPDAARPTSRQYVEIVMGVCEPVGALHALGMVHRDLKPSTMFRERDRMVLLGFGVASLPADTVEPPAWQRERIGTVGFMSPEQARGEPPRPTDDVFSLGAILYRGVCRINVYGQGDEERIFRVSRSGWVNRPPPGQPPEFERVLVRATASEAADRYPSVAEFKAALADVLWCLPG